MKINLEIIIIIFTLIAAIAYFLFHLISGLLQKKSCCCGDRNQKYCSKKIMDYLKKNDN